jgi:hypothetical protein
MEQVIDVKIQSSTISSCINVVTVQICVVAYEGIFVRQAPRQTKCQSPEYRNSIFKRHSSW